MTRAGYYAWKRRSISAHEKRDLELKGKILAAGEKGRHTYGSLSLFQELSRQGEHTYEKRAACLLGELGIRGVSLSSAKRPDDQEKRVSRKDSPEDQVKRDFTAEDPNEFWLGNGAKDYRRACR